MKEKEIERILVEEVKKLGGKAFKWASQGNAGVPDRIVVFRGEPPVFVELKSEAGSLTPLQRAQIRRLEDLGQIVRVVKGIDGVSQFFRELGALYRDSRFEEASKALDCRFGL